jgi:hypothetical protein
MALMDRRIVQLYRQCLQQPEHLSYPLPKVLLEASIQDQIFNTVTAIAAEDEISRPERDA